MLKALILASENLFSKSRIRIREHEINHPSRFGPRSLADVVCPSEINLIYSPFTPFNQAEYTALNNDTSNACWWWASCLLSNADPARVQQFSATSLVMGLVPLTLKDIAWPERRVVSISRQLPRLLEIFVRALGIVPSIDTFSPKKHAIASTTLYGWTQNLTRTRLILMVALSAFSLLLSYGVLAVAEVYSKRSSLGCPYPIFVLTWNLVAIFPAALETAFRRPERRGNAPEAISQPNAADDESPVQGRGKPWLIQLVWAIYYIAGTLVYSSIMAVTVIELFVWVITSIALTAASKFLAFFLCMAVERKPRKTSNSS
ncbi:hypothetical protein N431DRAFT_550155 [Stipitochalara longipes BDJ]|nr:hypothetical protein N431DRAFT_550155 [Stipitochalara longipes BDJ]